MNEETVNLINDTIKLLNDYVTTNNPSRADLINVGNETVVRVQDLARPLINGQRFAVFSRELDRRYEEYLLSLN
tara:strand:+ start:382 stop:603 length:222 start_codon:yes stop_codon:yes gene_type:complete